MYDTPSPIVHSHGHRRCVSVPSVHPPHVAAALESIAANVRRLRDKRGLSQFKLAAAADVEPRYIARIEAGGANPSAAILVKLATALDVTVATLFRPARREARAAGRPRKAK